MQWTVGTDLLRKVRPCLAAQTRSADQSRRLLRSCEEAGEDSGHPWAVAILHMTESRVDLLRSMEILRIQRIVEIRIGIHHPPLGFFSVASFQQWMDEVGMTLPGLRERE